MAYFIELRSENDNTPLLVNIEAIGYVECGQDGLAVIHMSGTSFNTSPNKVLGSMQIVKVKETYQVVKSKLSNYYDRF